MNTSTKETGEDPSSRANEESSSLSIENDTTTQQNGESSNLQLTENLVLVPGEKSAAAHSASPEMKRSAVKELIERYFFQLQRGCGNPECTNVHCASSGQVTPMTPNEIAARAIQLFSQDAQLCDFERQPPKVPRTKNDSPSSSRSDSAATTPSNHESDILSPNDSSSSSISSGNTTIISASSSRTSSSSTNTNISSFPDTSSATKSSAINEVPSSNQRALTSSSSSQLLLSTMDFSGLSAQLPNKTTTPVAAPVLTPIEHLDEQILDELIEECKNNNTYDRLLHVIDDVFSSTEKLSRSFRQCQEDITVIATGMAASKLHELLGKSPNQLKKEDLRMLEGEADKDEDCTVAEHNEQLDETVAEVPRNEQLEHGDTMVDLESLRRATKKLFRINNSSIGGTITGAVIRLADSIKYKFETDWEKVIHCFVICFDMATNTSNSLVELEYLERSLPKLCQASRVLSVPLQARLARIWAAHCKDQLLSLIRSCQQLITLQVIMEEENIEENSEVIAVTKVLKIAFYANILAGQCEYAKQVVTSTESAESEANPAADEDDIFLYTQTPKPHHPKFTEDKLEVELGASSMDCRVPLVPFEEFYNEALSDAIHMDRDYLSYKNLSLDPTDEDTHFSFMLYSFILTPASKILALYYDSRIRMYSERNSSLYSLLNYFGDSGGDLTSSWPDLKLKVRRENIIDDALIGLEMVAMGNPKDLKKQLVVEFIGEQGIDEGGVSKEFFQLIVEELFNPDFGMFTFQEDTNTVWFNSSPFENEAQFTLIGIILGLAIYNNIILAVHFPMVVYRKLMGRQGSFFDLADWNPTLYRSLKSMLDYQENDMEEVFMQTFKIRYNNVFGELVEHELIPGGSDIIVGQQNKQEFVDLYSDFLLNKSIERQFKAFKKGFEMVTDESPLKLLFRPEEIELLVCGSRKFDFFELEKSTEYEGGYTKDTPIIKDFWNVVHSMPEESQRKLLEFTTGSDRVPVGGLSRLKLLITRHGPDSDRLPTSHTCFNVLLLPEYNNKEKLEERLLKAINYSKGFGML